MQLGLRIALGNLYVVSCLLPWQAATVWVRLGVGLAGLALLIVLAWLDERPSDQRLFGGVALFVGCATLRPWPPGSFLVLLGSTVAPLLFGLADRGEAAGPAGAVPTAASALRWRRRMNLTSLLGASGAGVGLSLLVASSLTELSIAGAVPATGLLLAGTAGLLGLFVLRQFFLLPVLEHVAEDSGVQARLFRARGGGRGQRWRRVALYLVAAAVLAAAAARLPSTLSAGREAGRAR